MNKLAEKYSFETVFSLSLSYCFPFYAPNFIPLSQEYGMWGEKIYSRAFHRFSGQSRICISIFEFPSHQDRRPGQPEINFKGEIEHKNKASKYLENGKRGGVQEFGSRVKRPPTARKREFQLIKRKVKRSSGAEILRYTQKDLRIRPKKILHRKKKKKF